MADDFASRLANVAVEGSDLDCVRDAAAVESERLSRLDARAVPVRAIASSDRCVYEWHCEQGSQRYELATLVRFDGPQRSRVLERVDYPDVLSEP